MTNLGSALDRARDRAFSRLIKIILDYTRPLNLEEESGEIGIV
jgi:hypothetical protein